ncbi:hypothetical protein D050_2819, partial [Vibrio parahaemolyticus VPCR-2009]
MHLLNHINLYHQHLTLYSSYLY